MWVSGCDFATLHPQRLKAVFCACVCTCAWSGYMHIRLDIADIPSRICACWDPTHTMINIRNVGELRDTWKPVSVFKRKIHHGSFEEWVTGWWFLPTILSSGMNTDNIFFFLEFPQTRWALYEGNSIFFLFWVWGGWENRSRSMEANYPNHRRKLKHIRHFSECRFWDFP